MKTKILVYGVLGYTGNLFLERALDTSPPIVFSGWSAGCWISATRKVLRRNWRTSGQW